MKATDEDSGENGRVTYRLDDKNSAQFSLHPSTGELRTKTFLDYEQQAEYQVLSCLLGLIVLRR